MGGAATELQWGYGRLRPGMLRNGSKREGGQRGGPWTPYPVGDNGDNGGETLVQKRRRPTVMGRGNPRRHAWPLRSPGGTPWPLGVTAQCVGQPGCRAAAGAWGLGAFHSVFACARTLAQGFGRRGVAEHAPTTAPPRPRGRSNCCQTQSRCSSGRRRRRRTWHPHS